MGSAAAGGGVSTRDLRARSVHNEPHGQRRGARRGSAPAAAGVGRRRRGGIRGGRGGPRGGGRRGCLVADAPGAAAARLAGRGVVGGAGAARAPGCPAVRRARGRAPGRVRSGRAAVPGPLRLLLGRLRRLRSGRGRPARLRLPQNPKTPKTYLFEED